MRDNPLGRPIRLLSLYPTLANLGLIIVPNGYASPLNRVAGTPYGSSSVSHDMKLAPPTEDDLEVARLQGARVARVAAALAAGLYGQAAKS